MTNYDKLIALNGTQCDTTLAAVACMDEVDRICETAGGKSLHISELFALDQLFDRVNDIYNLSIAANYAMSRLYFAKDAHRFLDRLISCDLFEDPKFELDGSVIK